LEFKYFAKNQASHTMKKSTIIYCLALISLFVSCSNFKDKTEVSNDDSLKAAKLAPKPVYDGIYRVEGDSVVIPSFEIEVELSPKAEAKIEKDKESIIVSASFSGIPIDPNSPNMQEWAEGGIAGKEIELMGQRVARFENIKVKKSTLDSVTGKDLELLINVYTGRRTNPDNLLDCGILSEKMAKVQNKKFALKAKLIYGE
jgi:hypothetical protein